MHNELIVHNWGSRLSKGNVAMNTRRNAIAGFLAAIFAGGVANDAPAQQPQSAAATGALEEIVVTARRREENFQELPLSIAAITSDTMATMGIYDVKDIHDFVPNVTFRETDGRGSAALFIRGIGGGVSAGGTRSSGSAAYLDGHYIAVPINVFSTLDMERIEVLRGPQGTLFGKNTTGGLIQYITTKPQPEFGADIVLRAGDFGQEEFQGTINVPFSDTIWGRFSLGQENYDGHWFNRSLYRDYGKIDLQTFSGALRLTPNENWTIDLAVRTSSDESDQTGGQCTPYPTARGLAAVAASTTVLDVTQFAQAHPDGVGNWGGFGGVSNIDRIYPGATADFWYNCHLDNQAGPYVTSAGHEGVVDREVEFYSAVANWDSNGAIGGLDNLNVQLTASHMEQTSFSWKDADYSPLRIDAFGNSPTLGGGGNVVDSNTLELLFTADVSDRLSFVAGTHWYKNHNDNGQLECYNALKANFDALRNDFTLVPDGMGGFEPVGNDIVAIPCFPSSSVFDRISDQTTGSPLVVNAKSGWVENESLGVFGQLSFALNDDWTLDFGARYTTEDRAFDFIEHNTVPGTCVTNPIYFLDDNLTLPNAPTEADLIAMGLPTSNPGASGPTEACLPDSVLTFNSVFLGGFTNDLEDTFTKTTPMVSLTHTLAPGDRLESGIIYGTISQGFLSGAFNDEINLNFTPELAPLVTILPETVTNYEVGFKGTLADGRAQLATAVFFMDYEDKAENIDIPNSDGRFGPEDPIGVTANASSVEIYGIEFELRATPWDGGFLSLDVGYLKNEYSDFTAFDETAPGQQVDRSGATIRAFSPEWTITTSLEHEFVLGNGASLTPSVSVYYQDNYDFTSRLVDAPPSKCNQEAYAIGRARVNYLPPDGAWQASLFGSNITDKRYWSFCNNGRGGVYDYTYGAPDRWGLEFRMNFDG